MLKAVILDVGGVLHWHDNSKIVKDIVAHFGVPARVVTKQWTTLAPQLGSGKIDEATFWEQFQQAIGMHKPLPPESLLLQGLRTTFKKNDEIFSYIKSLKQHPLKLAILSNTIESHANFLRSQGIYDDFDAVILSYQVGMRKPDPRIYEYALHQLGVTASEAVLVDDDPKNIEVARSLGMQGIIYKDFEQLKAELDLALS